MVALENKCNFYSFQISVYLNHSLIKAIFKKRVVRKYLLSRVDNKLELQTSIVVAVPWVFPLEFVCKSRVCLQN